MNLKLISLPKANPFCTVKKQILRQYRKSLHEKITMCLIDLTVARNAAPELSLRKWLHVSFKGTTELTDDVNSLSKGGKWMNGKWMPNTPATLSAPLRHINVLHVLRNDLELRHSNLILSPVLLEVLHMTWTVWKGKQTWFSNSLW